MPEELHAALNRTGKRRWWIPLAVVVALAIVVSDLETKATPGYRASALSSYLSGVHADVAQCNAGLRDAVAAFVRSAEGAADVPASLASSFTSQAIAVCSFTNSGVVSLGEDPPPRSISSRTTEAVAPEVDAWAYLDAFDLLQELRVVMAHPGDTSARRAFDHDLALLMRRERRVAALVRSAEQADGSTARSFTLTNVRRLLPGGRLDAGRAR